MVSYSIKNVYSQVLVYCRDEQTFHAKGHKLRIFFFRRSQYVCECDLRKKIDSPRFSFQLYTVEAIFFENHCYPQSLKEKMVFRSIHCGSLNFCKCRRARIKDPASRIWPAGRSLPLFGILVSLLH